MKIKKILKVFMILSMIIGSSIAVSADESDLESKAPPIEYHTVTASKSFGEKGNETKVTIQGQFMVTKSPGGYVVTFVNNSSKIKSVTNGTAVIDREINLGGASNPGDRARVIVYIFVNGKEEFIDLSYMVPYY